MPAPRKLSQRQLELLIDFAESHRDIALGRFPGGPLGSQTVRRAWESIAIQLNSVAEGTTKTPDQWRRYWTEFKAKTKSKAADSRRNASSTGGGPNKLTPLSEFEKRVLALIGPVAVEGLPGVRIPIDIPSTEEGIAETSTGPSTFNLCLPSTSNTEPFPPISDPEPLMNEEWLEECPSPIDMVGTPSTAAPTTHTAEGPVDVEEQPYVERPQLATDIKVKVQPVLEIVSKDDRRHSQEGTPPAPKMNPERKRNRQEGVPRWAYDLEARRIAGEERLAAAVEVMSGSLNRLADILQGIREDINAFITSRN